MNCEGWKIFRDIARTRSFSKAARQNYLTQPAVSIQLKRLEEELGVKLIERSSRTVKVTADGERLLPYIEELLARCETLKDIAAEKDPTPKGTVRVATIPSVGMYELSHLLSQYIKKYPHIHLHLQYRRSDIIYDLVRKDKADIGIVAYPEPSQGIHITPFGSDHMVVLLPRRHPLAHRKRIRFTQIDGEKFIAFDNNVPTGKAVNQLLKEHGVQVRVQMVNDNIDMIKKCVELGIGISIVPKKTVVAEVQTGHLHTLALQDVKLERPLGILTRQSLPLAPAPQTFLNFLTSQGRYGLPHKKDTCQSVPATIS